MLPILLGFWSQGWLVHPGYLKARPSPTAEISSRRLALRNTSVSVHSLISFNAGGAWSTLKAPSSDSEGQPISCGNGCSLHLHDMTFQEHFVPFYSYDKAVGIIMAAGNVGQRLSYKAEESNTYLSRDGGLSWSEVRKGVHIYEFGNHGAVLVMASVNSETNQVIYSLDEGKTWQTLAFGFGALQCDQHPHRANSCVYRFRGLWQSRTAGCHLSHWFWCPWLARVP